MVKANDLSMANVERIKLSKTALDYLIKVRKLEPSSIEEYGLCMNSRGEIQILFRDHHGDLRAVKRRAADGTFLQRKRKDENSGWEEYECKSDCIPGAKPALLGSHLIKDFNLPLLISFGEYDTLTLHGIDNRRTFHPVSPPFGDKSLTWIDHQFDWLEKFNKIIIFPDFDHSEKTRKHLFEKIEELSRRLGKHKCWIVQEKFVLDAKDPNDLYLKHGKDALFAAIKNIVPIPEPGLESLADYEGQEFIEGVPTGYHDYDAATGGLIYGGLTLISGDNNAGKTTNILNILGNVVAGGNSVFYWSGEQKADKYRWWLEQIFAGPVYVDHKMSPKTGRNYHFLRNDLVPVVRSWYHDKFFHYNKRGFDSEELFRVLELAVRRHGVFLICIDNLMAFTGDAEEYYASQAAFVESCKNFAVEWNVHIMLVVHNRKNDPLSPGTKDDVEGSKKIVNWADALIQIFRVSEPLKNKFPGLDAIWSLCKNRETEDLVDIGMIYEPTSKRIAQQAYPDRIERLMGWEEQSKSNLPMEEYEDPGVTF